MTAFRDSLQAPALAEASRLGLNKTIAKMFFVLGFAISLVGVPLYGLMPLPLEPGMRTVLVAGCLLLAMGFAISVRLLSHASFGMVVMVVGWSGVAMVTLISVGIGEGIHNLGLGFFGLLVCLVTVLTSRRAGTVLALACAAAVVVLAWVESMGRLPGAAAVARNPKLLNVMLHGLMLATAVVAGSLMSRMVNRALAEAEEREHRFSNLLRIAADWYWELDADLRFSRITNHTPNSQTGLPDEYLGRYPWDVLNMSEGSRSRHRAVLQARRPFADLSVRLPDATGEALHVFLSGRPRFDEHGRFDGYWGVGRDVTSKIRAHEALAASESRYRELFALSPTPLVLHRDGLTMQANESAARLFGFHSDREMVGFDLALLYPEEARGSLRDQQQALARESNGKSVGVAEIRLEALDGRRLTVQADGARVNAPDGPAVLMLYHDITARVDAEAALRRSQAMLSHLFATSPDYITLSDMRTGTYVLVNRSFTRMFGYTPEEVVGKSSQALGIWFDPADRVRMLGMIDAPGGPGEMEAKCVHKSGRVLTFMMSAGRFSMDGRDYLVVNGRDVTDVQRVRLEHEAILRHASIGIALTRDRHFAQANPRFEAMFGWEPGELLGRHGRAVWGSEDDYAEMGRIAGPLLSQGKRVEVERQMTRRDGSLFWCRLLAQVVDPTHPSLGGTIWIAEDVTERRQIDQALAAARDVAEAANRAKSAFLANTSHEIRTPLNGLIGLASLAMQPGMEEPRRQQYLEQILDSAQSLAGIMSDILDLSKIEAGKFSIESVPFNLHNLLHAVQHAYRSLAHARSMTLVLQMSSDVPSNVCGDPVRLRQILSNYLTNALKFTERGEVRIEVSRSVDPETPNHIRFTVDDTGPGIDVAMQPRLFQPFTQADESTTRRFGGTGLGLSICKELATLMAGTVGVDSTPGAGSRFWAELPLPQAQPSDIDPRIEVRDANRLLGMRVLLVEDNPVNMMIAVAMLEQWGVSVTQATDGSEGVCAVERASAAGRPFHLVLMDVQMPVLSGHEAARQLRATYPPEDLPIVALTAAALVSEREEALAAGMNDFLTKPIDAHRLREVLVRAMS